MTNGRGGDIACISYHQGALVVVMGEKLRQFQLIIDFLFFFWPLFPTFVEMRAILQWYLLKGHTSEDV